MEKPILFNTQMVKAILNGSKTQTRRLIKPQPPCALKKMTEGYHAGEWHLYRDFPMMNPMINSPWGAQYLPPCQPGDVLWVRETWAKDVGRYMYRANYSDTEKFYMNGREIRMVWCPSIHMPKDASRLFLQVKDVRAERLQDMKMPDMQAEGAVPSTVTGGQWQQWQRDFMKPLWNSTIKSADLSRYGWDANPWVWVIEFERLGGKPAGLWADQGTAQYADQDVLMPAT